jgi:hypothetical protein
MNIDVIRKKRETLTRPAHGGKARVYWKNRICRVIIKSLTAFLLKNITKSWYYFTQNEWHSQERFPAAMQFVGNARFRFHRGWKPLLRSKLIYVSSRQPYPPGLSLKAKSPGERAPL